MNVACIKWHPMLQLKKPTTWRRWWPGHHRNGRGAGECGGPSGEFVPLQSDMYMTILYTNYICIYMYIHINLQVQMHMLVRSNSKTYWTVTFQHIVWGFRICAYKYFPIKWISLSENHLFTIISPGNNLAKGGYWTSIALGDFNKIQQGFTKQS